MFRFVWLIAIFAPISALYSENSPVKIVPASEVESIVSQDPEKFTFVEYFAPWCVYCQKFAPIYEQLAKDFKGAANILAVDCNSENNKKDCGEQGIDKLPTIKRVYLKNGSVKSEEAETQNYRLLANMIDDSYQNCVKIVNSQKLANLLLVQKKPSIVVFGTKVAVMPALKFLAHKYTDRVDFVHVYDTDEDVQEHYGLEKIPVLTIFKKNTLLDVLKVKGNLENIEQFILDGLEKAKATQDPVFEIPKLTEGELSDTKLNILIVANTSELNSVSELQLIVSKHMNLNFRVIDPSSDIFKRLKPIIGYANVVALNAKKYWLKSSTIELSRLEYWIDEIFLGQGGKKIPMQDYLIQNIVGYTKKRKASKWESKAKVEDPKAQEKIETPKPQEKIEDPKPPKVEDSKPQEPIVEKPQEPKLEDAQAPNIADQDADHDEL